MLFGKGMFVHYISRIYHGDYELMAREARDAQLTHVIVKVANGYARGAEGNVVSGVDLVRPFAQAMRNEGIKVLGFQAVYGVDPAREAAMALSMINGFNLEGFVIDAEGAMKGKHAQAREYMRLLRPQTNVPLYLSSYRYPTYHPQYPVPGTGERGFPWKEYIESGIDGMMPQVYWIGSHNPGYQLNRSVQEFENLYRELNVAHVPIIPTGAAFCEWGWCATPKDVHDYLREVKNLVAQNRIVDATNFWEWYYAVNRVVGAWAEIASFIWGGNEIPVPPPTGALGVGRVLVTGGLTIRDGKMQSANYRGAFGLNATPYIFEHYVKIPGIEEWVRVGKDLWSAMYYNGVQLIRWEERY